MKLNFIDIIRKCIDKSIRSIEDRKRQEIAKSYQATVNFLTRKNSKYCLKYLDELKYLDRNPFVDGVYDYVTPFTKGREHKLTVRLVQSNYRIKKNGDIHVVDINNDVNRCKSYDFYYTYYKPASETNDTEVKLYYCGYNINMTYSKDHKTYIEDENK